MKLDHLIFEHAPSPEDLATILWQWGVACLPNYIPPDIIKSLNDEFDEIYNIDPREIHVHDCHNGEMINVLRSTLEGTGRFRNITSIFSSKYITDFEKIYFGWEDDQLSLINEMFEIEINRQSGLSRGTLPHADRVPALKIILYLTDTDQRSGATFAYPGTHMQMRRKIQSQLDCDPNPLNLKNFPVKNALPARPYIEGPAGTLIVVDTFCIHGGGEIHGDKVRKSIRGVSWPSPLNKAYFIDKTPEFAVNRHELPEFELHYPHPPGNTNIGKRFLYVP